MNSLDFRDARLFRQQIRVLDCRAMERPRAGRPRIAGDRRPRPAGARATSTGCSSTRDDWVTRDEAADALGVARSVAAFHLDKLAEAGLVEVRFERPTGRTGPGAGRPGEAVPAGRRPRSRCRSPTGATTSPARCSPTPSSEAATHRSGPSRPPSPTPRARPAVRSAPRLAPRRASPRSRGRGADRRSSRVLERHGYEPHERGGEVVLANCPFHALAERAPRRSCAA